MVLLITLLLLPLCKAGQQLWVHTANISVAIDSVEGTITHINTTTTEFTSGEVRGIDWGLAAFASAGENDVAPTVLSVSVQPCAHGSELAVCVQSSWLVHGQTTQATCCQDYNISVSQTFWPLTGLAGVPGAVGWTTQFRCASSAVSHCSPIL